MIIDTKLDEDARPKKLKVIFSSAITNKLMQFVNVILTIKHNFLNGVNI